jgi:hypothetical protein
VAPEAVAFPLPARDDLLARIPTTHPRLFLRPEDLPALRERVRTDLAPRFAKLITRCERLLASPPDTTEPPRYPKGTTRKSEAWREIWWGNRKRTIAVLEGAVDLAGAWQLGGDEAYGALAERLLLAAADWDPRGSTGYRYNDEAGMPYAYHFARAYTLLHDRLDPAARKRCQAVMAIRGAEMYRHLCPRHLWRPYSSHANRAWHFLGEVGIAFLGEIPAAADWVWFAHTVFFAVYPVWSDDEGGWHEGSAYWASYLSRFTWWAQVMRAATGIDAYRKPFFSQVGYYPLYLQPPGTTGGGFGDLTARRRARDNRALMTILAAQARNPHWQWYVEACGGPRRSPGFVGLLQEPAGELEARPPTDLPTARCFQGTGQAVLCTDLQDATRNVELVFKSSPFGSQSHGYEAQNAFLLYAFGERLLIRSGRRDVYGSPHHRGWMWQTRSVNSITVDGAGQRPHSAKAVGKIRTFRTTPAIDLVIGEAGDAYGDRLERFTRAIVFLKPEAVVVLDRLAAPEPAEYTWWLHAPTELHIEGQQAITMQNGGAACHVALLAPPGLEVTVTDRFDPPPRPRITLREWHLAARTPAATLTQEFVTVLRPHHAGTTPVTGGTTRVEAGVRTVVVPLSDGEARIRWGPEELTVQRGDETLTDR